MKGHQFRQIQPNVKNGHQNGSDRQKKQMHESSILLGVCATEKKLKSRPMREVLERIKRAQIKVLQMSGYLCTCQDSWPRVDALICFYSKDFPYLKAWRYIQKHQPFLINSFEKQQLLWDRSVVYTILKRLSVPTPEFFLLCRDPSQINKIQKQALGEVESCRELDLNYNNHSQQIELDAQSNTQVSESNSSSLEHLQKLLHHYSNAQSNIKDAIYQSNQQKQKNTSQTHLFRSILREQYKIIHQNKHLELQKIQEKEDQLVIQTSTGSYKFKKPFVQKPFDSLNHFIRIYYPQSLGGGSKLLFNKQKNESSKFMLDENSIKKTGNYIYQTFIPENGFIIKVYTVGIHYMYAEARKSPALDGVVIRNNEGKEVRYPIILTAEQKLFCKKIVLQFQQDVCGIQILRSQQGKSFVLSVNGWSLAKNSPKYWDDCSALLIKKLFHHFYPHSPQKHGQSISHKEIQNNFRPPINHIHIKVQQLRSIMIICRHADRSPKEKLKIKTKQKLFIELFTNYPKGTKEIKYRDSMNLKRILTITNQVLRTLPAQSSEGKQFLQMKKVLESGGQFEGLSHKVQIKVNEFDEKGKIKKIVIALKWGGELSFTGYEDSIQLGKLIRNERYKDHDLLSLYASYQHDLKSYSSQEGRCIKTAAAFLKGFLNLQGELLPIITSMVTIGPKAQKLLDCTPEQNHSPLLEKIQSDLTAILNSQQDLKGMFLKYCPRQQISNALMNIMTEIGSPRQKIEAMYNLMKELVKNIDNIEKTVWKANSIYERVGSHQSLQDESKCEDILLVKQRWNKLVKDFFDKETNNYNVSKLAQIYDTVKHDQRKNKIIFNLIDQKLQYDLKKLSKKFAYFIVRNQVGLTNQQKLTNAGNICTPLLEKVLEDMFFWSLKNHQQQFWKFKTSQENSWRHLRTRLYFTSASHLYSLLHTLTLGNNSELLERTNKEEKQKIRDILYMGYLSHIQFKEYENLIVPEDHQCRFRIQVSISYQFKKGKPISEFKLGKEQFYLKNLEQFLRPFIEKYKRKQQPMFHVKQEDAD